MPIDAKRSREVFRKLESDLIKLSSKPQAKRVHRFRTGTRRVQILLGELSPKLDGSGKKLLKLLNRIRKRAGKLRDLDVQLTALRGLKVPEESRRKTQLVNHLLERRAEQEKKLRKSADEETVREIRKRLKRAAKRFDPLAARDPLAAAKSMMERFDGNVPVTEAALHQYRILSKRARYAAELVSPASVAAPLIAEIKRFQDALGDWHDWLTLAKTAGDQLGEKHESPLVAELRNVTGAKYRRAIAAVSHMRGQMAAEGKTRSAGVAGDTRARVAAPQKAAPHNAVVETVSAA
jgi:CHAD domain-containing protein